MVGSGGGALTHFFRRRRQFDGGAPACGGAEVHLKDTLSVLLLATIF
jgi:hypothetical protein